LEPISKIADYPGQIKDPSSEMAGNWLTLFAILPLFCPGPRPTSAIGIIHSDRFRAEKISIYGSIS
jgi:hypothetical protein